MPARPKAAPASPRLLTLLDRLAGPGEGRRVLDRLLTTDEPPELIAEQIAATETFEYRYKEARTRDIVAAGRKEADFGFVGLPEPPPDLRFPALFAEQFRPRLGRRAEGFAAIFAALGPPRRDLLLIETGCIRIPRNWDGDGQSTFMFDALTRDGGGLFFSLDFTPESIETARRACSSATHLILNDSIAALHALSRVLPGPASLLYLDSYDCDPANPMPSAIHHLMEMTAARGLIGPGTIVCVDDYEVSGGGKGMVADMFFSGIRARVLHEGYQKVWQVD